MILALRLVLGLAVAAALIYFFVEDRSWRNLGMAIALILVWTPVKGLLFRRLSIKLPYRSAIVANASSELTGLPFHFGLSFWPLMGASWILSAAVEWIALLALGTARGPGHALWTSFYASLVVHLLTAGFFYANRQFIGGALLILAGVVLFHLPASFEHRRSEAD